MPERKKPVPDLMAELQKSLRLAPEPEAVTAPNAPARSFAAVLDEIIAEDACHWSCDATHGTGLPCTCHRPAALRQLAEITADAKALVAMHPEAKGRTRRAWALLERLAAGPQEGA